NDGFEGKLRQDLFVWNVWFKRFLVLFYFCHAYPPTGYWLVVRISSKRHPPSPGALTMRSLLKSAGEGGRRSREKFSVLREQGRRKGCDQSTLTVNRRLSRRLFAGPHIARVQRLRASPACPNRPSALKKAPDSQARKLRIPCRNRREVRPNQS